VSSQFPLPPVYRRTHQRLRWFTLMVFIGLGSALACWLMAECTLRMAERYVPGDEDGGQHLSSGREVK